MPARLRHLATLVSVVAACCCAASATAAPRGASGPAARLTPFTGLRFESPIWVGGTGSPTTALYVAEQGGMVWRITARGTKARFLDLRRVVSAGGEQGLLAIAFAHDFRTSGRMFAYFTTASGDGQVRQYRVRAGRVVPGSARVVINVRLSPPGDSNHNGGQLWSTRGGHLYLSVGDGGGGGDPAGNAQRMDRLTGKLLRIAPRLNGGYAIPRSNPYVSRRGARGEIYALGLRNPWRFSIDAPTGDIWIGDVGQGEREEIDRLRGGRPAGANFGWRRVEGNRVYDAGTRLTRGTPYARPFFDYTRGGGECSVTGGVVYRGPIRALRGWYLHADFCTDDLQLASSVTGRRITRRGAGGIVHFGAGRFGHVYAASVTTGRIYRVAR